MPRTELDPHLADVVADIESLGVPEWHAMSVDRARRIEDDLFSGDGDPVPVGDVENRSLDGPDGDVRVRVYRPPETPAPTLVFYHGGGWCLGTLDSADDICRELCRRVGAVVVSVDYRLAPEHPFPAAVEDAAAALAWVRDRNHELGGNGRVGVAGTSAGGNLAAAMALQRPAEDIAVQVLLYPVTDRNVSTDSYAANADGPLLTKADMEFFWEQYLRSDADAADPTAAPMLAETPTDTATAVVATAGHDPLRDDGTRYAEKLADAGVDVELLDSPSLCHGFLSFADDVPAADDAFDEVARAVRARL